MTVQGVFSRPAGGADLRTSLLLILLVVISPFLGFYAHNLSEGLPARDLVPYVIVTLSFALLIFLGLRKLLKPTTQRVANAVAVFVIVWFNYESISKVLRGVGFGPDAHLAAWLALLCVALGVVALLGSHPTFHHFLLLFAAVGLMPPLVKIITHHLSATRSLSATEAYPLDGNDIWSGNPIRRPDIYWLVLDSYPNERHLRDQYGLDNSGFVDALRELGFYVATDSHSNYHLSALSVTSTLNMEYIGESQNTHSGTGGGTGSPVDDNPLLPFYNYVAGDNRTVGYLHQLGYSYVHYNNGWFQVSRCRGFEDVCLRAHSPTFSELEVQLLRLVPYRPLARFLPLPSLVSRARRRLSSSGTGIPEFGDALVELAAAEARPLFVYAHFGPPHEPFVNESDCRLRHEPQGRDSEDARRLFREQVECVNRHLVELIRPLVRAEPSSIIIVSGDHGPRFEGSDGLDTAEDYSDWFAILNALRLPPECRDGLSPDLTLVNTMRVVFACLGDDPVQLLDARHYVTRQKEDGWLSFRRVGLP